MPAVLVGDIHRGGVFAHLYGTVAVLPEDLQGCCPRPSILNMFRGDPALLGDAMEQFERPVRGAHARRPAVPAGVVLDAEDSLHRMLAAMPAERPQLPS